MSWKKFPFVERAIANDERTVNFFKKIRSTLTKVVSCGKYLVFSDDTGNVHIFNKDFKGQKYQFFQKLLLLNSAPPSHLLCVGNNGGEDSVDVYDLSQTNPKTGSFYKTSSFGMFPKKGRNLHENPTYIATNRSLTVIAIGLRDGKICLYQGDFKRRRSYSNMRVIPPQMNPSHRVKGKTPGGPESQPLIISFLGFKSFPKHDTLFVVTSKSIFTHDVYGNGKISKIRYLEETLDEKNFGRGTNPICCMRSNGQELVVGGKNGIWFYNEHGHGGCVGFGGVKAHLHSFKDFLAVVSLEKRGSDYVPILTIYDLIHKIIVYKKDDRNSHFHFLLSQWNFIMAVVRKENQFYSLHLFKEIDLKQQIRHLIEKNRYELAYKYVKPVDPMYGVKILKEYGDYEYKKKNFSRAMDQYIKTIGFDIVEPSYVIRKFLDAQRIEILTKYLEKLHDKNVASPAHTTLLLNCYTKLKYKKTDEKLDNFIEGYSPLQYDVETAIAVCRQANYIQHALKLALRHQCHEWVIRILIENKRDYRGALKHIESLDFRHAEENLRKYSKVFLQEHPKETTNVLIRLCVNYIPFPKEERDRRLYPNLQEVKKYFYSLSRDAAKKLKAPPKTISVGDFNTTEYRYSLELTKIYRSAPSQFIQAYSNKPFWLMVFLENVIFRIETPSHAVVNTIIELYLRHLKEDERLGKVYFGTKSKTSSSQGFGAVKGNRMYSSDDEDDEELESEGEDSPVPVEGGEEDMVFQRGEDDLVRRGKKRRSRKKGKMRAQNLHGGLVPIDDDDENDLVVRRKQHSTSSSGGFLGKSSSLDTQSSEKSGSLLSHEGRGSTQDCYDLTVATKDQAKSIREKLLMMLTKYSYNEEHVTFLVHSYQFSEGILELYKQKNSYHEVIQHYMKEKDYDALLRGCRKYGKDDQNLWIEVLNFFADQSPEDLMEKGDQEDPSLEGHPPEGAGSPGGREEKQTGGGGVNSKLKLILNDENVMLPPLQIIQILSKNENTTLGVIKDYLVTKLSDEKKEIEEDIRKIRQMRQETESMEKEVEELRTKAKIFQSQKCFDCKNSLKLPSIHFMCGHSYHQECLKLHRISEKDRYECKICQEENQKVTETVKRFSESSENHEPFFNQLSTDPSQSFATVAEYFGRSIFKNLDEFQLSKKNEIDADDEEEVIKE